MSKVNDSEHYNVTDFERAKVDRDYEHDIDETAYSRRYPDDLAAMHQSKDSPEWLLTEAISKFYLERLRTIGSNKLSTGVWYQQSWTHQILFYRLLLHHASTIRQGGNTLGVSRKECLAYMKMVRGESYNTLQKILSEGMEAGHLEQTDYGNDKRNKVLFLPPTSVYDYIKQGLDSVIRAAASSDLVRALEEVEREILELGKPTLREQLNALSGG